MRWLLLALAISLAGASDALAQSSTVPAVQVAPGVYEPAGPSGVSTGTVQVIVTAAGTTAATVATIPAVAAKTNYICGFSIDAQATAGAGTGMTITGVLGGTQVWLQSAAAAPAIATKAQNFTPCLPAAAVNTAIVVTSIAAGTGGVTEVNVWGFVR